MFTQLKTRKLWFDGNITVPPNELSKALSVCSSDKISVDAITPEVKQFNRFSTTQIGTKTDCNELDKTWRLPAHYASLDVTKYVLARLEALIIEDNHDDEYASIAVKRVLYELRAFESRELLDLLRTVIYVMETFRERNQVWGVGRGSSVASYVLFLIGAHDVDSIKYELDFTEFMHT